MPSRSSVTGHYAGPVTRLVAYLVDAFVVVFVYGLLAGLTVYLLELFTSRTFRTGDGRGALWLAGLVTWAFVYLWASLSLAGRTPGKALVGLRVVASGGQPLGSGHALLRVLCFPLSFALVGAGLVGIVVGRKRRALHDVVAGSVVVYDWGDRPAQLPAPLTRWLERHEGSLSGRP